MQKPSLKNGFWSSFTLALAAAAALSLVSLAASASSNSASSSSVRLGSSGGASSGASSYSNDNDDVQGFDSIVNQLRKESTVQENTVRAKVRAQHQSESDPFANVLFHPGFGLTAMTETVSLASGQTLHLNQHGIQASLGIDLFSDNWMAEGTARALGGSSDSSTGATSGSAGNGTPDTTLQEFELKVIYRDRLTNKTGFKIGVGLSARYLTVQNAGQAAVTYTTPTGVVTAGYDYFLTEKFSIGADLNGRSAMISETPDRGSVDGTLRLDFHL
jgi:hypothetical protein